MLCHTHGPVLQQTARFDSTHVRCEHGEPMQGSQKSLANTVLNPKHQIQITKSEFMLFTYFHLLDPSNTLGSVTFCLAFVLERSPDKSRDNNSYADIVSGYRTVFRSPRGCSIRVFC